MAKYTVCDKIRPNKRRLSIKIGDKFDEFTVIDNKYYKTDSSNHIHIKCICSCGHECYERLDHLKKKLRGSCYKCSIYLHDRNRKNIGEMTGAMFSNIMTRAKERELPFNLTMEYLNRLYQIQNGKCALSKIDIRISKIGSDHTTVTASLDRIDPTKGYIEDNVQWVHKRINIMKGNLMQNDFIGVCKLIYEQTKDLQDNFDPSTLNGLFNKRVGVKEQRLTVEEPIQ